MYLHKTTWHGNIMLQHRITVSTWTNVVFYHLVFKKAVGCLLDVILHNILSEWQFAWLKSLFANRLHNPLHNHWCNTSTVNQVFLMLCVSNSLISLLQKVQMAGKSITQVVWCSSSAWWTVCFLKILSGPPLISSVHWPVLFSPLKPQRWDFWGLLGAT